MVIILTKSKDLDNLIKQSDKPIAFVLGKYITTGLGVIRCLGRCGVPVIWLDSAQKQFGFSSKYCVGINCPNPRYNEKEYVDFLSRIGERLNHKGVLFPIGDIEVMSLLKNKSMLEKFFLFPMADLDVTNKLLNKKLFYKILKKLNIDHPKTYFPKDKSDLKSISTKITYPCIIKPSYSALFVVDFKTKLFFAQNSKQLIQLCERAHSKKHNVMIQEIIPGSAKNMHGFNAYYDGSFNPNGVFMYRRIREWLLAKGNGCFIESVKISMLEDTINQLIKKIKYYGIVDAEIKKDPRDNRFKLIEINPRCWMQISFPARCSANLPYIAYLDAIGKKFEKPISARENVKWLNMTEDIRSSMKSILKRDLSIFEWIKSYRGEKEYAFFAKDDPMPFFLSFLPFYFQ